MSLSKNNKHLEKQYRDANVPSVDEFSGEYRVKVLTGPVPRIKGHKKKIYAFPVLFGENIIGNKKFGLFSVEDGTGCVVFDYNQPKNTITRWLRMTDEVRRITKGHYLGKIFFRGRFMGFFTLTKITKKENNKDEKIKNGVTDTPDALTQHMDRISRSFG